MKYLSIALMFLFTLQSGAAMACYCSDSKKAPAELDEAFKDASLVFVGTVEKTTWRGMPTSKKTKSSDGKVIDTSSYVDPSAPEKPFFVKNGPALEYKAYFKVENAWKDSLQRIEAGRVAVTAINGGWCGFQFKQGQKYLVFGRDGGNAQVIPAASICSRTKPLSSATDDVAALDKKYSKLE